MISRTVLFSTIGPSNLAFATLPTLKTDIVLVPLSKCRNVESKVLSSSAK